MPYIKRPGIFFLILGTIVFLVVIGFFSRSNIHDEKLSPPVDLKKLNEIQPYELPTLIDHVRNICTDGAVACMVETLQTFVAAHGPVAATEALHALQQNGMIPASEDDHQISHKIGRKTAEVFGVNGEAFVACPTAYNYGCQHGFFEYALGRAESPKEAAEKICGSLGPGFSEKYGFYCYHGVGHGVLMAKAYDLYAGLAVCDTFSELIAQDGCWQGVFMENVNAAMRGEARSGTFSATDALAPCSTTPEKYRHECFINHAGWLMKFFGNDVARASAACLAAHGNGVRSCLESIGLMVSNPSWQGNLAPGEFGGAEEIAWKLCQKFPTGYTQNCVVGAVDNIMNFDELKTDRAMNFCSLISEEHRSTCAERIGFALKIQSIDSAVVVAGCTALPEGFRTACLSGAGLPT